MKAKICDNLLEEIEKVMPNEGHKSDPQFLALRDRIQGKVVELGFIGEDAFEAQDDCYWLPNSCWTEIKQKQEA